MLFWFFEVYKFFSQYKLNRSYLADNNCVTGFSIRPRFNLQARMDEVRKVRKYNTTANVNCCSLLIVYEIQAIVSQIAFDKWLAWWISSPKIKVKLCTLQSILILMGKLRRNRALRTNDDLHGNKVTRFVTNQTLWRCVLKYTTQRTLNR